MTNPQTNQTNDEPVMGVDFAYSDNDSYGLRDILGDEIWLYSDVPHKLLALIASKEKAARIDEWRQLDFGVNIDKNFVKQRIANLKKGKPQTEAMEELQEIRDMALVNYKQTNNYDMKVLANYCENRLQQLAELQADGGDE